MNLYFVRHGTAVSTCATSCPDAERPLTSGGGSRFLAAARALAKAGALDAELVLTSPLVRARQTADLLCEALTRDVQLAVEKRLSADTFDLAALVAILGEHAKVERLAIVGHNPSFERVLGEVIGGAGVHMHKGAIALVEIDAPPEPAGRLHWLAPTQLFEGGRASRQASE
jgi:phosphohistidine phosphatase